LARQKRDLETLAENHQQRMLTQQAEFERKYEKNQNMARESYTNQGLNLERELINQKKQFLKAADKYTGDKHSDPFYQIRDNSTDFSETSGAYVLKAKVAEHEKDNVNVRVKNDKVTLTGNRNFNDEIREGSKLVRTHNVQTFHEQFPLEKKIKENEVIKNYDNGVLTVIIPKVT
jgi:HSP20 family molecular chaperone IbpA